jgi:hypothetical protein
VQSVASRGGSTVPSDFRGVLFCLHTAPPLKKVLGLDALAAFSGDTCTCSSCKSSSSSSSSIENVVLGRCSSDSVCV